MDANEKQILNFLVNPGTGRGKSMRVIKEIAACLNKRKILFKVFEARTPLAANEIVNSLETAGETNVIAVGGDGTLSEAVNSVKELSKFTFGFIPAGMGNDTARTLKISKNPITALKHVLSGKTEKIDYLQGNSRRAVNFVATGFGVEAVKRSKASLLKAIFRHKPNKSVLQIDGGAPSEREFLITTVTNGQYFGGGMRFSPNANIKDGKMNLIVINSMPKAKIWGRFKRFFKGRHINDDYVEERLCTRAAFEEGKKVLMNFDGEILEDEFVVKNVHLGLTIFYDPELNVKKANKGE